MGFLKKLGQILVRATEIAVGIGPIASQYFPAQAGVITTVVNDLTAVGQAVVQAEVFGQALGLPGPDKLKAAIPAALQIFRQSQIVHGRKVKDEAKFTAAVAQITGGVADLLSSLDDDIKTEDH